MKPARKVYDISDAVALLAEWEREDANLETCILAEVMDEESQPQPPPRDPAWAFPALDVEEEF